MFPGADAQVYYNEAGEPLGWDYPSEPEYCPDCGGAHSACGGDLDGFDVDDYLEDEEP